MRIKRLFNPKKETTKWKRNKNHAIPQTPLGIVTLESKGEVKTNQFSELTDSQELNDVYSIITSTTKDQEELIDVLKTNSFSSNNILEKTPGIPNLKQLFEEALRHTPYWLITTPSSYYELLH